ncbi:FtsX-like permease family protein [Nocardioides sp. GCM10027113]|uniref:ABC transporter permease n=1 Tax=unclassified Nocardioides TaxID=2615069 RepID=UPI0036211DC5
MTLLRRRLAGWRPSLRMAWRDAWRHKGRSILTLVMIALPVLGVVAADIVIHTARVSGAEALERRLGAADARITVSPGAGRVVQDIDPDAGMGSWSGPRQEETATLHGVAKVLGREVRAVEMAAGAKPFETDEGIGTLDVVELEVADPLAAGLYDLTEGSWPTSVDEVAVSAEAASRGPGVGEELVLGRSGVTKTVVGIAEDASSTGFPLAVGLPGSFGLIESGSGHHTWLVDAGPVTWDDVLALNAIGASVLSRAVLLDPPPRSALDPEVTQWDGGPQEATIAVAVLIVVMALLEVVLLAGPAFAVGARRQARTLALMAASGGTPRQARRVVLASAIVLGSLASALGVLLGLVAARALLPVLQGFSQSRFGPFEVPWTHVGGVAAFGLTSALLAAVVPAWLASRQDVVAVLGGRRGDRAPSLRSPALGVALLAASVGGAVYGALRPSYGEIFIAGSAVVAVLGMILLVPVVLVGLARTGRRLPLVVRYALRDAARHRTRTVPAVAAVAATVSGVVALGIAVTSDSAEYEATYSEVVPRGTGLLTEFSSRPVDWDAHEAVLRTVLPEADIARIPGVSEDVRGGWLSVELHAPGDDRVLLSSWGSSMGSSILVGEGVPAGLADLELPVAAVERVLGEGGALVFTDAPVKATEVEVTAVRKERGSRRQASSATLPAVYVDLVSAAGGAVASAPQMVLSPAAARELGLEVTTRSLFVTGAAIDEVAEDDVTEALNATARNANFYVERGYQTDDETRIILLVLGGLGGVLMLGGTLTATFLALADARPDLATLSAVGAAPRTRRGVAAAYAVVVGGVGALLGALVGFVPGVAVTYPLTGEAWVQQMNPDAPSNYLDVPWLLIGALVLALPLVTALVVGLFARSRLPLVARIG